MVCQIFFKCCFLSALKTVFKIVQNNNIMKVIPNENTNFVLKCSEFDFSEFEFFDMISHSLVTIFLQYCFSITVFHQHDIHQLVKTRSW